MNHPDAWAVSIEVDGRQRYLFETDKLQEMVGASAIMRQMAEDEKNKPENVQVFQPASGDVRAWSTCRTSLLKFVWAKRERLTECGVEHTVTLLRCHREHFDASKSEEQRKQAASRRADTDPLQAPEEPCWPDLSWVHKALTWQARRAKDAKAGSDARPVCSLFEPCRLHPLDFATEWNPGGNEDRRALRGYRARHKFQARQSDDTRFVDMHVKEALYKRARKLLCEARSKQVLSDQDASEYSDSVRMLLGEASGGRRPILMDDLVVSDLEGWFDGGEAAADRFVAFVCADADGLGQLLTGLDWNDDNWNLDDGEDKGDGIPNTPWERNRQFSMELDDAVRSAFRTAIAEAILPNIESLKRLTDALNDKSRITIPVLPQLLGGDDLWAVVRKDVALGLCRNFAGNVPVEVGDRRNRPVLAKAIARAGNLTMSMGIAFAKAGHPAHAMIEAAESLLASAKALRKGNAWERPAPAEGCLDWHWIESSLTESVGEARARGTAYVAPDTGDIMLLTTRPWTLSETKCFEEAAAAFAKVPRRKREQLEDILRRGHVLSLAAWEIWWLGLRNCERQAVRCVSRKLPEPWRLPEPACEERAGHDAENWRERFDLSPWIFRGTVDKTKYFATPFIDLLALHDLKTGVSYRSSDDSAEVRYGDREPGSNGEEANA